jgi:hypothetical protein
MTPAADMLNIKNFTADTGQYWYWDDNYQIEPVVLSQIFDMHVGYFENIKKTTHDELQTWPEICQRVDTTKFPYFKVNMIKDRYWRYPFTRYQGRQMTGNGRTMFSLRHAPDVPKTCVHVFTQEQNQETLERLHTVDQLIDLIEQTPYWRQRLATFNHDVLRTWRLIYTPDLGLYWIDCIFGESMEGDWFHYPAGHDQTIWKMTIGVVKSYDHFNHDNVLDVIDHLIEKGVPMIKSWCPTDF